MLAHKVYGDLLDVLAPLGNGFTVEGDFDTAVLIGGGLGVAPFPLLTKQLKGKEIITFVGGRSEIDIVTYGLKNVNIATDDGSLGRKGTVVDLFMENYQKFVNKKIKVFGCGPTPMLKALQKVLLEKDIEGEISTECAMACGFGICQGCPIEDSKNNSKYLLVCKDGPVFNIKDVLL
jgi:dihydroorotate dehydrogenase electron transfer subunit